MKNTKFGAGHGFHGQYKAEHQILDDAKFETNSFIQNLKDKAWSQLGSSGGGNHFVEFGLIDFKEDDEKLNYVVERLEAGTVWINQHGAINPFVPFGGTKQSGYGVEFGIDGLKAVTQPKIICYKK